MSDAERTDAFAHLPMVLVVLGVVLIATSFLPFSSLSKRAWTIEDSEAFSQVTRQMHDSTLDQPGRSRAEAQQHRAQLQEEFERLNAKLEQAQNRPHRWSRLLLWIGAGLAAAGAAVRSRHH